MLYPNEFSLFVSPLLEHPQITVSDVTGMLEYWVTLTVSTFCHSELLASAFSPLCSLVSLPEAKGGWYVASH